MRKGLKVNLEGIFHEAVRFYQAENFVGAENVCRKILCSHPDHGDTLNLIGLVKACD